MCSNKIKFFKYNVIQSISLLELMQQIKTHFHGCMCFKLITSNLKSDHIYFLYLFDDNVNVRLQFTI